MAQLVVRNVDEAIVRELKQRAARRNHSAEQEHREILEHALLRPKRRSLAQVLAAMPDAGNDADFEWLHSRMPLRRALDGRGDPDCTNKQPEHPRVSPGDLLVHGTDSARSGCRPVRREYAWAT